jgi:hypothetical protein
LREARARTGELLGGDVDEAGEAIEMEEEK